MHIATKVIPQFSIFRFFLFLAVASLPFVQVFAVDIGWPLKIYEILFCILIPFYVVVRLPRFVFPSNFFLWAVGAYFTWVLLSFFFNALVFDQGALRLNAERFGQFFNGISYLVYFLFDFFVLLIIYQEASFDAHYLIKAWLIGAFLSACYAWYLFISSIFLGEHISFHLPMMGYFQPYAVSFGSGLVIRNGTFLEGNFAGLYFILTAMLACYVRKYGLGLFFALTLFTTLSTGAILFLAGFFIILLFRYLQKLKHKNIFYVLAVVVIFFVSATFILLPKTDFYQQFMGEKLFSTNPGSSRVDRIGLSKVGVEMGENNPVFGVGIGQYGFHYNNFSNLQANYRRIANNVYIQVFAEEGLFGLLLFCLILFSFYEYTKRLKNFFMQAGALAILILFNFYPTYLIAFVWVYIAIMFAEANRFKMVEKYDKKNDLY